MRLFNKFLRKLKDYLDPFFAKKRINKINNTDFTIISNNCWAGYVYRFFGLKYLTPTIGLYFFSEDYLKFISNLKFYISLELKQVNLSESKYKDFLISKKQQDVPIGKLDDIEIIFLHYKTFEDAKNKWERRKSRINLNNIIIKFSEMNSCSRNHLERFINSIKVKTVLFVKKENLDIPSSIFAPSLSYNDDTTSWNKYLDIINVINEPVTKYSLKKAGRNI